MSLNDWVTHFDGGTISSNPKGIAYTDILSPIIGTGSVVLTNTTPTTQFQSIVLTPATAPTGFIAGRMRSRIRLDNMITVSNPTHVSHVGLLCMQSVENMAEFGAFGGMGECYGMSIAIGNGFSTQAINFHKFTAGIDGSSGSISTTVLDSAATPFSLSQGSVVSVELSWRAEPLTLTDLGGAYFVVRVGQMADFSDLQDVITYLDASSPYGVSVSEGIWAGLKSGTSAQAPKVTFDQTSIYRTITV